MFSVVTRCTIKTWAGTQQLPARPTLRNSYAARPHPGTRRPALVGRPGSGGWGSAVGRGGGLQEVRPFPPATNMVILLQLPNLTSNAATPRATLPAASPTLTLTPHEQLRKPPPLFAGEILGPDKSNDLTKVTRTSQKPQREPAPAGRRRSPPAPSGPRIQPGFRGAAAAHSAPAARPPPPKATAGACGGR